MATDESHLVPAMGAPTREFHPSVANLVAGFILGGLLVAGGAVVWFLVVREVVRAGGQLPIWVDKGMSWGAAGLGGALATGMIGGGIWLVLWLRSVWSQRVYLCPNGFYCRSTAKTVVFPWEQIASVRETVLHEHMPIVKGPAKQLMPSRTNRIFVVHRADGEKFAFDGNTVREVNLLGDLLQKEAEKRQIPWEIVEEHS